MEITAVLKSVNGIILYYIVLVLFFGGIMISYLKHRNWFKPKFKPSFIPDYLSVMLLKKKLDTNADSITLKDMVKFLEEEKEKMLKIVKNNIVSDGFKLVNGHANNKIETVERYVTEEDKVAALKRYLELFVYAKLYGKDIRPFKALQMFNIPRITDWFNIAMIITAFFTVVYNVKDKTLLIAMLIYLGYFIITGFITLIVNGQVVYNLFIEPTRLAYENVKDPQAKIDVVMYTVAAIIATIFDKDLDRIISILTNIPGYKTNVKDFLSGLYIIAQAIIETFYDEKSIRKVIFFAELGLIYAVLPAAYAYVTMALYIIAVYINKRFRIVNYHFISNGYLLAYDLLTKFEIDINHVKQYRRNHMSKLKNLIHAFDEEEVA